MGRWSSYSVSPSDKTDWILHNIFNCSDEDICLLRQTLEDDPGFYCLDGFDYAGLGGVGDGYFAEISSVKDTGTVLEVEYDIYPGIDGPMYEYGEHRYAVVDRRQTDGGEFWSLYYDGDVPSGAVITRTVKFDNNTSVDLNWGWALFNKDASEYSHDLAMAGCILSQAAEMGESEAVARLAVLGFENFFSAFYDTHGFWGDPLQGLPAFTFASRKISLNGEDTLVIAAVVRGSSDIGDWLTDLHIVPTGFTLAAVNLYKAFTEYYAGLSERYSMELTPGNTVFYVTGHSLGGAVAGELGALFEEENYGRGGSIFTYTFASPNYQTFNYDREALTNVHNIINTQDAVPNLPWGYKRYGHDWYYDGKGSNIVDQHLLGTYLKSLLSGVPKNIGSGAANTYSLSSVHCPVDI